MTPDQLAANPVTLTDIAARTGSPEDAAELWVHLPAFPRLLVPEVAGGRVWWWPDVRGYILSRAGTLSGYVPPPAHTPVLRPRPQGKRGPNPGSRVISAFDLRVLEAMHGQANDRGEPRFTPPTAYASSAAFDRDEDAETFAAVALLLAVAHPALPELDDDEEGPWPRCPECGSDDPQGEYGCVCWDPSACSECGDNSGTCECWA